VPTSLDAVLVPSLPDPSCPRLWQKRSFAAAKMNTMGEVAVAVNAAARTGKKWFQRSKQTPASTTNGAGANTRMRRQRSVS
jgi:hypothetical protein